MGASVVVVVAHSVLKNRFAHFGGLVDYKGRRAVSGDFLAVCHRIREVGICVTKA